jgi:phage repressor protein C with HTH and peptisase S24 domain
LPAKLKAEERQALARFLDIDEQELSDTQLYKPALKKLPNVINIDMLDVFACCGNGTDITSEPVIGTWQMPIVDFNAMSLTKPENIKIIKAVGDSMTPTVQDGDYVFVDISNQYITSDGVYVLRLPTGLLIKRIQNGLNGDVIVRSDNPAYEPLTAKLSDVRVLGRVVRILNQRKI